MTDAVRVLNVLIFIMQEPGNLVVERREERPSVMNAFELISTSQGLNLGTLFEKPMVTPFFVIFVYDLAYLIYSL